MMVLPPYVFFFFFTLLPQWTLIHWQFGSGSNSWYTLRLMEQILFLFKNVHYFILLRKPYTKKPWKAAVPLNYLTLIPTTNYNFLFGDLSVVSSYHSINTLIATSCCVYSRRDLLITLLVGIREEQVTSFPLAIIVLLVTLIRSDLPGYLSYFSQNAHTFHFWLATSCEYTW